jgi:F-type H+/Na+-transporting ATPase subunit alpha
VEDVRRFEAELLDHMRASEAQFLAGIRDSGKLSEEAENQLIEIINNFKKGFAASGGASVVPDAHVEPMDEEDLEKESVQVKKEKPKDKKESKDAKKDKK